MRSPHEVPWLHDALDSLLDGEPASSPVAVVDDVRRGRAARAAVMRRRAVSLGAAAVITAAAVPLALAAGARPVPAAIGSGSSEVGSAPADASSAATPTAVDASPSSSSVDPLWSPAAVGGTGSASASAAPPGPSLVVTQSAADIALARQVPCTASQLRVTYGGADGAGGTNIYSLDVVNVSPKPCGLVGPASVRIVPLSLTYRTATGGLGGPADHSVVDVVLLPPGRSTTFQFAKYRCDYREGTPSTDVDVRVNGSLVLVLPFSSGPNLRGTTQCTGGPTPDPGNAVTVYGWQVFSGTPA